MRITTLIQKLERICEEHGDLVVGYDEYNDGYGGTQEITSLEVLEDETLINEETAQTVLRLT